jgi:hypothetical protein
MDNQLPTPGNEPPAWKALQSLTNPYSDQARAHIWDMAIIEAMRTVLAANPQAAQAQPVATAKLIVREPTPEMVAAAKQWAAKGFDWPAAMFRAMWDAAPQDTAPVQAEQSAKVKDHVIRQAIDELVQIARYFHAAQQLRDRIRYVVLPLIEQVRAEQAPDPRKVAEAMRDAAAMICNNKRAARVASGHPREASTARALTQEIRSLDIDSVIQSVQK